MPQVYQCASQWLGRLGADRAIQKRGGTSPCSKENKLRGGRRDSKVFHSMPARPTEAATATAKTHEATPEMQRKEQITNQKQTSKTRKK